MVAPDGHQDGRGRLRGKQAFPHRNLTGYSLDKISHGSLLGGTQQLQDEKAPATTE